jgi:hypothetical protein
MSSTSSGSSCNISEESILKTDSDNEEVEREQKAKKRRFFFSLPAAKNSVPRNGVLHD